MAACAYPRQPPPVQASVEAGAGRDRGASSRRGSSEDTQKRYDSGRAGKTEVRKYAVIIEQGPRNYSAYIPDLPGCIATGKALNTVRQNIKDAIQFHIDGLREDGVPIPEPSSVAESVEIQAS